VSYAATLAKYGALDIAQAVIKRLKFVAQPIDTTSATISEYETESLFSIFYTASRQFYSAFMSREMVMLASQLLPKPKRSGA